MIKAAKEASDGSMGEAESKQHAEVSEQFKADTEKHDRLRAGECSKSSFLAISMSICSFRDQV